MFHVVLTEDEYLEAVPDAYARLGLQLASENFLVDFYAAPTGGGPRFLFRWPLRGRYAWSVYAAARLLEGGFLEVRVVPGFPQFALAVSHLFSLCGYRHILLVSSRRRSVLLMGPPGSESRTLREALERGMRIISPFRMGRLPLSMSAGDVVAADTGYYLLFDVRLSGDRVVDYYESVALDQVVSPYQPGAGLVPMAGAALVFADVCSELMSNAMSSRRRSSMSS